MAALKVLGLMIFALALALPSHAQSTPYANQYRVESLQAHCNDQTYPMFQPHPVAGDYGGNTECTSPLTLTLPAGCYHFAYTIFREVVVPNTPHDGVNVWIELPDVTRIAGSAIIPASLVAYPGSVSLTGSDDYCIDAGEVAVKYATGNTTKWNNVSLGMGMAKDLTVPSFLTATPLAQ